MKNFSFITLLLLMPLFVVASVVKNPERICINSSIEQSQFKNSDESAPFGQKSKSTVVDLNARTLPSITKNSASSLNSKLRKGVKRSIASDITLVFDECQVLSHPALSMKGDLDQYAVTILEATTGNKLVLYLYTTKGSNGKLPAGTYTYTDLPTNNGISGGVNYNDEGELEILNAPFVFYDGYSSSIKSGSVVVSYNATNEQEITLDANVVDRYKDTYVGTCTHVLSESDLYMYEKDAVSTPFDLKSAVLSYNFYPKGENLVLLEKDYAVGVFSFFDESAKVNMNISIRQTLGTSDVKISAGTYSFAKSGDNTVVYSLGSLDDVGLSSVLVSNKSMYYLVSGSVVIAYDSNDNLKITVDAHSYNGTQFKASGIFNVNEYNFRDEPTEVITIDAKTDAINVYNEGDELGNNTDYMVLDFVTQEDIIRIPFIAPIGSDDQVPVGTYEINSSSLVGSAAASAGTDISNSNQATGCILAKGAALGSVSGFYFIETGSITVAKDTEHAGEYVYDLVGTTHYGSTINMHAITFQDPEKPFYAEPKKVTAFTTNFDDMSEDYYESSDDVTLDTHVFEFKWKSNPGTKLALALRCAPHSGKAIPAGVYDCAKNEGNGGIAVSTGQKDQGGGWIFSTYSYAELIKEIDEVNYSTFYFIKSGTVTVSYPTEGSTDRVLYKLDLVTHYGSTFKLECEIVADPEEAFKGESKEITTVDVKDCSAFTTKNYGDAYNKDVDVYLLKLLKEDNILALEVYVPVEGLEKLPAGDYPIAAPYTTNSVVKGQGFDGKYQVGSFAATGATSDGYVKALYYLESGNLNVAYSEQGNAILTLNATSHFGSTVSFTYNGDIVGVDTSKINPELNVYTMNSVVYVNLDIDNTVEVYNAIGQMIYSGVSTNGELQINGLRVGQLYIVKSGTNIVKVVL